MKQSVVAIVTGASRGAGRGIAIALGRHGCTVYVTGRSLREADSPLPGTIFETADLVTAAGGKGIAVCVDHNNDADVAALFDQVKREQGRLDILVSNAFQSHDDLAKPGHFWEKPLDQVDMWNVGLRGAYVASYHAAKIFSSQQHGLLVFTSAPGAQHYVFGPAYGVHKAGLDKMAADMAVDFKDFNVASISIWMGALLTDRLLKMIEAEPERYAYLNPSKMETPEFTGHIIWALFNDPDVMAISGQHLIGAELAVKYNIKDSEGRQPPSYRDTYGVAPVQQHPFVIKG